MALEDVNKMIREVLPVIGSTVAELGDFAEEMMIAERLAAMLLVSACVRYNKQPEDVVAAFNIGFKQAVDDAVYGKKQ